MLKLPEVPQLELGTADVIVVSDLHLGDGGLRDNFAKFDSGSREKAWLKFLNYVESRHAQLVIVGDLFEFWQCNLSLVLKHRLPLLDRLAAMKAIYVIGNHDGDLLGFIDCNLLKHPFFQGMNRGFRTTLGGKHFRFLHGHETDEWNSDPQPNKGRIVSIAMGMAEDKAGGPYTASGQSIEAEFEVAGEGALGLLASLKNWFLDLINRRRTENENGLTPVQKPSLYDQHLQQMLALHAQEKSVVLIVGHTHRPGHLADWYWNSGSWANLSNDFLELRSDGTVSCCRWVMDRPEKAEVVISAPAAVPAAEWVR